MATTRILNSLKITIEQEDSIDLNDVQLEHKRIPAPPKSPFRKLCLSAKIDKDDLTLRPRCPESPALESKPTGLHTFGFSGTCSE